MSTSTSVVLARQEALATERFTRNDVVKDVFVVAKNFPFVLEVAIAEHVDLKHARISATLLYDNDLNSLEYKPVDTVKKEPLSYKIFSSGEGAKNSRVQVEVRLFVLTSQHEDSLFRVKICVQPNTDISSYEVISEPIRVVSKPSQVHKPMHKPKMSSSSTSPALSATPVKRSTTSPSTSFASSSQMVHNTDPFVLQAIARLEQQQREQQFLIDRLLQQLQQQQQPINNNNTLPKDPVAWSIPSEALCANPSSSSDELEAAFDKFLAVYGTISMEDRPSKMRKLIDRVATDNNFYDFISHCNVAMTCTSPTDTSTDPLSDVLEFVDDFS